MSDLSEHLRDIEKRLLTISDENKGLRERVRLLSI